MELAELMLSHADPRSPVRPLTLLLEIASSNGRANANISHQRAAWLHPQSHLFIN